MSALPIVLMTEEEVAALGRDSDAGFGALRTERGLLPLAAMDVDARIAGVVAAIDVAQTFVNTTGQAIEATYIFPLPDRAAVHRFRMEVAGRVIEGVVDERGAARERYDEAIAKGHRAAITEEERAAWRPQPTLEALDYDFDTALGDLDLIVRPLGPKPGDDLAYASLIGSARLVDVGGRAVHVADAEHLVASKLGSRRPKDLRARDELERLATPNG